MIIVEHGVGRAGLAQSTLIVNHLRSPNDIESVTDVPPVRAMRTEQAEYIADIVQEHVDADPDAQVLVLGDFNAYELMMGT